MKLKKYSYIIVLILMLVIGINTVKADSEKTCYYISTDDNLKVSLKIGYNYKKMPTLDLKDWAKATIWQTSKGNKLVKSYSVENWFTHVKPSGAAESLPAVYEDRKEANNDPNPSCPKYVIYTECPGVLSIGTSEKVYATDSSTLASSITKAVNDKCSYSKIGENYQNGKIITEDMFFADYVTDGLVEYDQTKGEYTCSDMDVLFGSKDDPESIRYMINQILGYVRVIVPILIILLGMIDFAKAVLAGKQDNMKKAQSTFIKRLVAGIVVFLIPTLVDIVMGLADIVWQGTGYIHCDF